MNRDLAFQTCLSPCFPCLALSAGGSGISSVRYWIISYHSKWLRIAAFHSSRFSSPRSCGILGKMKVVSSAIVSFWDRFRVWREGRLFCYCELLRTIPNVLSSLLLLRAFENDSECAVVSFAIASFWERFRMCSRLFCYCEPLRSILMCGEGRLFCYCELLRTIPNELSSLLLLQAFENDSECTVVSFAIASFWERFWVYGRLFCYCKLLRTIPKKTLQSV